MSNLPFVNIPSWVPDQVASWLKGLDEVLLPYVPLFIKKGINGKKLLILTHTDLRDMGIFRLGHRELILEAIEMLRALYYELEHQTVQSLALRLSCRTISLCNDVFARLQLYSGGVRCEESQGKVPLTILSAVSDVIGTIKQLVSWLDRAPFDTSEEFVSRRNTVITLGMDLLEASQRENPIECEKEIMDKCRSLAAFANAVIRESKDSLVIQPVSLEICTLRKKPEDDLGMHLSSLYNGTHIIGSINEQSPADLCGKVDDGDELVQVNYQTVVGWHLTNLVAALKDNKKEVTLTLKKRPRHVNLFGTNHHRKKVPKNVQQSTFPRKSREDKTTRAPLKDFLNTMPLPTEFSKDSSQEPDSDNENEVFQTTSTTPCLLPLPLEAAKQRRATVSGGSPPAGKRNSLEICDLGTPTRPKSYTISSPTSDVGSPGSELLSPRFLEDLVHSTARKSSIASGSSSCSYKHGARRSSSTSTPRRSMTPTPPVENSRTTLTLTPPNTLHTTPTPAVENSVTTLTLTPPNTLQTSTIFSTPGMKTSLSDNNIQIHLPVVDSPTKRRKSSDSATGAVAKANDDRGSPQLLRITRINSQRRAEIHEQDRLRLRPQGGASDTDLGRSSSTTQSYTVNIVAGVPQKVVVNKELRESPTQSPSGLLRRKHFMRHMGAHRRVSCKDLGHGDCQGWLYKRKEGLIHGKWVKRWFILKQKNLYYYKSQEDEKAQGVIHLPGFKVSPAPDIKSKKYAFKAFHTGMTFIFASDRQEDMGKWMNKMGLAAIVYDTTHINTTAGFRKPDSKEGILPPLDASHPYYSESDDEDSQYSGRSTPTSPSTPRGVSPIQGSPASSREDLSSLHSHSHEGDELVAHIMSIRREDIAIDGKSSKEKRVSSLSKAGELDIRNPAEVEAHRKWSSLQRTLKAKERELSIIEELFQSHPITSTVLSAFKAAHPEILEVLVEDIRREASSEGTISESDDL